MTAEDLTAAIAATEARLNEGVAVASYSVAGRSYSFRSLEEQRDHLQFLRAQLSAMQGSGGNFSLASFARI